LFTQLLQGGTGIASGAASLFGAQGAFPAVGAAAGSSMASMLPMMLPFLSDRRAKENIKRVGTLDNGLPVYAFNYKGHPVRQIGLMADEVELVNPSAVVTLDGTQYVDYEKATQNG